MKNLSILIVLFFAANLMACSNSKGSEKEHNQAKTEVSKDNNTTNAAPEHLTYDTFLKKVWNFETNPQEWVYEGDVPCVIDFYATWCGPCKRVAPIMEELAKKYDGKIKVYKIDVDQEKQLASVFRVRSIPSVLFIPKKGKPQMQTGAMPRDAYFKVVKEQLLGEKSDNK
ncbi:MAG: thioredoxin [Bacteroidetes bacterium]|nr:MAG: thioredoxin [Bacteroidota bacterium]